MCAWAVTGGDTRQKIDLSKIIDSTLEELKEIESSQRTQSEKTKLFKRLAVKVKTALHDDGRKKDDDRIKITTYKKYMTTIRNAIKAQGYTHHSLNNTTALAGTLPRVMKDFPEYAEMLATLRNEPADTMGARVHEILETIRADKANKRRSAAYTAVKGMRTDHEIMYHLKMDEVQRADFGEQHAAALDEKKNNTVQMAYADIQSIIADGFKAHAYSRRAFALALASGRRAVEILFNASFEKTGAHTVMFTGQAKKRTGIEAESYEVFTLCPADDFLKAFAAFRQMEEIQAIHNDFGEMPREQRNTEINKRTAKTLNDAAKAMLASKERSFKDSRAIYARVCIDTHWNKATDEDAFVTGLLGHDNNNAQAHYKQFIVDYSAPATTKDTQGDTSGQAQDAGEQETADDKAKRKAGRDLSGVRKALAAFIAENPTREGLGKYHQKVEAWAALNPSKPITQTALQKQIGGNRQTIKDYLSVLSAPLDAYNEKRA